MVRVFQADGYAATRAKQFSLDGIDPTKVLHADGSEVWEGSTIKKKSLLACSTSGLPSVLPWAPPVSKGMLSKRTFAPMVSKASLRSSPLVSKVCLGFGAAVPKPLACKEDVR